MARYSGSSTLEISSTAHGAIRVRAELTIGEGEATAQGDVFVDGRIFSSRQWQLR